MRFSFSVMIFCFASISYAQSDSPGFKLESVYLWYSKESLRHDNQIFNHFSNTVDDASFFVQDDSSLEGYGWPSRYQYKTYSAELGFRKGDSKWRYVFGATYNQRLERSFFFQKTDEYIVDTVYAPVVVMTGESTYSYNYDTLLLDSIMQHKLNYQSTTKNIFAHAAILRDFKKNKYTISTGVGLGVGMSVKNEVRSRYNRYWGLSMVREQSADDYESVWYADIPKFSPVAGTLYRGEYTEISADYNMTKGNTIFIIKPYIPLRVEARIAEKGFFSKLGVMGSANTGFEIQIVRNDGIRSRFFWNYQAGLFYNL